VSLFAELCTARHLSRIETNSGWKAAPELDHLWQRHCLEAGYVSQTQPDGGWRPHFFSERRKAAAKLEETRRRMKELNDEDAARKHERRARIANVRTSNDDAMKRRGLQLKEGTRMVPVPSRASSAGSKSIKFAQLQQKHQQRVVLRHPHPSTAAAASKKTTNNASSSSRDHDRSAQKRRIEPGPPRQGRSAPKRRIEPAPQNSLKKVGPKALSSL